MSLRTDIGNQLVTIFSAVSTVNDCSLRLRFLDEIEVFPSIYVTAGNEQRQYLPGMAQNRLISYLVRIYVNEENSYLALNTLIEDVEAALNNQFETDRLGNLVTNITIEEITTDEGILDPEGVAELVILATTNQG